MPQCRTCVETAVASTPLDRIDAYVTEASNLMRVDHSVSILMSACKRHLHANFLVRIRKEVSFARVLQAMCSILMEYRVEILMNALLVVTYVSTNVSTPKEAINARVRRDISR